VGSSLGELRLDYEVELKDNSVDGAAIVEEEAIPYAFRQSVYGSSSGGIALTSTNCLWVPFTSTQSLATDAIRGPIASQSMSSSNKIVLASTTSSNGFILSELGVYRVTVSVSAYVTCSTAPPNNGFVLIFTANKTAGVDVQQYVPVQMQTSLVASVACNISYMIVTAQPNEFHSFSLQFSGLAATSALTLVFESCSMYVEQIATTPTAASAFTKGLRTIKENQVLKTTANGMGIKGLQSN